MRDILVFMLVMGSLPFILARPHFGVYMWAVLAFLNPHRLTWSFAYDFPFAQIVALTTIVAWLASSERKAPPMTGGAIVIVLLWIWTSVTTLFALNPEYAYPQWEQATKMFAMLLVALAMIQDKRRLIALTWIVALGVGFYGLKGGIFAVATGGSYRVFGPDSTQFYDNNQIAMALLMVLPLMRFLQTQLTDRRARWAMGAVMAFCFLAVLSTYSRGAALAIMAIGAYYWLHTRRKLAIGAALAVALGVGLSFMPNAWWERMGSIQNFREDASVQGRFDTWLFTLNLVEDHPILGGGFKVFIDPSLYPLYNPDAAFARDVHSIYFQALGEHGYVGLGLFLALMAIGFRNTRWTIVRARGRPDLKWAVDLASMLRVGMIAYAVAGAFLSLAFMELYYYLIGLAILTKVIAARSLAQEPASAPRWKKAAEPVQPPAAPAPVGPPQPRWRKV